MDAPAPDADPALVVNLDRVTWETIDRLILDLGGLGVHTRGELVELLFRHVADGVERPGSWERGWLSQVTGWWG
jgi:hypothetical protein